jgi:hypothetical protein
MVPFGWFVQTTPATEYPFWMGFWYWYKRCLSTGLPVEPRTDL